MQERIESVMLLLNRVLKKKQKVIPEHSLVEDLGLNSIQFMELISMVESEFDVIIPVQKLQSVKRVSDLFKIVENIEQFCV